jgi:sugar/nucleoside kinase (ribokinase family)
MLDGSLGGGIDGPVAVVAPSVREAVVTVAVIGNVNVDLIVWPVSELPPPGQEHRVERIELRPGGAAGITGAVLARLGVEPIVVGSVGDDLLGAAMIGELDRYGVPTSDLQRIPGSATGTSIAFEGPHRDRSFLSALGSLARFEPSKIPDAALRASFVLLCGYFNLPSIRGRPAVDLLRAVKDAGGTTLLDTGWDHDGWPEATREETRRLLPLVDVFLPNGDEVAMLGLGSDPAEAARAVSELSGGRTVVKLGTAGCVAAGPNGESHRVPAPTVNVVDTTGAGDAFNAGLIWALSAGEPWADALRTAVRVASSLVARPSNDRFPSVLDLRPSSP